MRIFHPWPAGCLVLSVLLGIEGFTSHIRCSNFPACTKGSVLVRSFADAFTGNIDSINSTRTIGSIEDVGVDQESKASTRRFWRNLNPFKGKERKPGTLILVRHGDSVIRDELTFTGWIDVDLSDEGVLQVKNAARLIASEGYTIDLVYTSRLKRAIRSAWILMQELNQIYKPVYKSWRLNERMYGALEGLSKPILSSELGEETVRRWRTSLFARPPPMTPDHKHWHFNERKYADLEIDQIPTGESLNDTMVRTIPLLNSRILPLIEEGQNVLICAHGNSLRGIVKHIDNLNSEQIQNVKLPNGIPLVYKFEREKSTGLMKPIRTGKKALNSISGEFLEKTKGKLEEAIQNLDARETELRDAIHRQVESLTMSVVDYANDSVVPANSSLRSPQLSGIKSSVLPQPKSSRKSSIQSPYIVITRHGKTTNNILGQFTGWQDAALSPQGKQEATEAGKLLKAHGIEFDIVYTSWLSRTIETAWRILDELDLLWLPIIKSWRLNERHYGALTSMSKNKIKQKHGETQFKLWRRGYSNRPPPVTSFSEFYPGNDDRYRKYVKDVRISKKESLIRSLASGRLEIHKKFPKTESLKDCMERTIPYFRDEILKNALEKGQNVLVATHENAIRGLLMYLCDIDTARIAEIEIPTGLPLVYNVEKKCIQLLDDGTGVDPVDRYDFGESPELLFAPCDIVPDDGEYDETTGGGSDRCFIGSDGRTYSYDPIIRFRDENDDRIDLTAPKTELRAQIMNKLQEQVNNPQSYNI